MCFPWKIRTFLMFPNPEEGSMAPQFHSADTMQTWDCCHGPGRRRDRLVQELTRGSSRGWSLGMYTWTEYRPHDSHKTRNPHSHSEPTLTLQASIPYLYLGGGLSFPGVWLQQVSPCTDCLEWADHTVRHCLEASLLEPG